MWWSEPAIAIVARGLLKPHRRWDSNVQSIECNFVLLPDELSWPHHALCRQYGTYRRRYSRVNGQIHPHQLNELRVIESKHITKVGRPIEIRVNGGNLSVSVKISVDYGSDGWQLGNEVHAIFITGLKWGVFQIIEWSSVLQLTLHTESLGALVQ